MVVPHPTVYSMDLELPLKKASPEYTAVMVWAPPARELVDVVATPPVRGEEVTWTPSTLKVTMPVGVPVAGVTRLTVAVRVTDCPKVDDVGAATSEIVELPMTAADPLGARPANTVVRASAKPTTKATGRTSGLRRSSKYRPKTSVFIAPP
jgi:hypothetical protein